MDRLKNIPYPGYRIIKTAICVVLCIILYSINNREGILLATIAAIICMQDSVEKSISLGVNRVRGTLVGGLFGGVLVLLGVTQANFPVYVMGCFFGVILFIYVCTITKMKQSIVIGCMVFLMILMDADKAANPLAFCFSRTLDTLIGIIIAIGVNQFMFRPKPERTISKEVVNPVFHYDIRRSSHHKNIRWSGGSSLELFIYPEDTFYSERDFDFRVSRATVEAADSSFTKLPGYKRYIMLIEGTMHLYHEGFHDINLDLYEQDCFRGEWHTRSKGIGTDINLMATEGYTGGLEPVYAGELLKLHTREYNGFYCLVDNIEVKITDKFEKEYVETLYQGDYIMGCYPQNEDMNYTVLFNYNYGPETVIALRVRCSKEEDVH